MKMRIKTVILIFLAVVLLIGGVACTMDNNNNENKFNKDDEIITQIKDYLSDKYGDISYEVTGFEASGWDHKYDRLNMRTEKNGELVPFYAKRISTEDQFRYEDNYFGVLIKEEYDEKVYSYASIYFKKCFVDAATVSMCYPNQLVSTSSFDDLISLKGEITDKIVISIIANNEFTDQAEFEKRAKDFCSEWRDVGLPSSFRIICVDSETFDNVDKTNYRENGVLTENKLYKYFE